MPELTERELTFAVPSGWRMPALEDAVPDGGRVEEGVHELAATYRDTPDHLLASLGITLRRRLGGHDAGWHLKVPAGSARSELQSGSRLGTPPKELTARLAGLLAGRELVPVATIRTTRRVRRVLDATGELVAEVADDDVDGLAGGPDAADARTVRWREIEVELGAAGREDHLAVIARLLVGAGAVERGTTMKLAQVIDVEPPAVDDALSAYLREQCARILLGEVRLRGEVSWETVHDTRVAVRRLRSTLRMFAPLVLPEAVERDDDLAWFAGLLGGIRDSDVLADQLAGRLDELPDALVLGPVRSDLETTLDRARTRATREWRAAGRGERYARTLALVVRWYVEPPVRGLSDEKLRKRGEAILRRATRTVERRLVRADDRPDGWHRARKATKRMRYTAEVLIPVLDGAREVVARAEALQDVLGEHQDLVVRQAFLLDEARRWGGSQRHQSFTLGVLYADADRRAAQLRLQPPAP